MIIFCLCSGSCIVLLPRVVPGALGPSRVFEDRHLGCDPLDHWLDGALDAVPRSLKRRIAGDSFVLVLVLVLVLGVGVGEDAPLHRLLRPVAIVINPGPLVEVGRVALSAAVHARGDLANVLDVKLVLLDEPRAQVVTDQVVGSLGDVENLRQVFAEVLREPDVKHVHVCERVEARCFEDVAYFEARVVALWVGWVGLWVWWVV